MGSERESEHYQRNLNAAAVAFVRHMHRFVRDHFDDALKGREQEDSDDSTADFERESMRLEIALSFPFLNDAQRQLILSVAFCAHYLTVTMSMNAVPIVRGKFDRDIREMETTYLESRDALEQSDIPDALTPMQRVVLYEYFLKVRFPTNH